VNLSAVQFARQGLTEMVSGIVAGAGLEPARLELEVTESALMRNADEAVRVLGALKEFGVLVSIDDFGTGYSSLAQLRQLPVDVLKIDRSFVQHVAEDPEDRAIAETVVSLARAIEVAVVAEGVETPEQDQVLRSMGCDFVQGFYYARPMPAAALAELLATRSWPPPR